MMVSDLFLEFNKSYVYRLCHVFVRNVLKIKVIPYILYKYRGGRVHFLKEGWELFVCV